MHECWNNWIFLFLISSADCYMYDVYLVKITLLIKFLLTQILIVNKLFSWSFEFSRKMTNHLEIKTTIS